jgi:poly [ADP-ribose] polymerase
MNQKYCKLIMVTPDNNNKYYEMVWNGGANFDVKYGRVEATIQTTSYPYSQWDTKYREKIKKGYKDVTDLVSVQVVENKGGSVQLSKIDDALVETFMMLMKRYTDNLVSNTYSVKAEAVSQKQVDDAQKLIDNIVKMDSKNQANLINADLVQLYTVIPRRMRNVRDYLLPNITLDKHMEKEQDNLDAMAAQVAQLTPKKAKKATKKTQNLLDTLGIRMKTGAPNKDIQYLIDQIGSRKVAGIFEIEKDAEDKVFDTWMTKQKNKQTRILIHGTRCTSVIPILEQGLKIRPAGNFQFSGKVYGDGNYYSETVSKSLNYTGGDPDKVLLVYEVHIGNPFVYDGWYRGNSFTLNYKNLQDRGFDSTFVKAGGGLLNSEIIAYNEEQGRIKYIIWLK